MKFSIKKSKFVLFFLLIAAVFMFVACMDSGKTKESDESPATSESIEESELPTVEYDYNMAISSFDDELFVDAEDGATSVTVTATLLRTEKGTTDTEPVTDATFDFTLKDSADSSVIAITGNNLSVKSDAEFSGMTKEVVVVVSNTLGNVSDEITLTVTKHTTNIASIGDVIKSESANEISLSMLAGTIESITYQGVALDYSITNGNIVLDGSLFSAVSGDAPIMVVTTHEAYNTSVTAIDYVISNAFDFFTFVNWGKADENSDKYIIFASNIDYENGLINRLWNTVPFNGTIDGRGYTVKNVTTRAGIFGYLGEDCVIKNLGLTDIHVVGSDMSQNVNDFGFRVAAGIAASTLATFKNCFFDIYWDMDVASYPYSEMTMIGGVTTNRDINMDGHVVMYDCVIRLNANESILSDTTGKFHSLKGVVSSLPDEAYQHDYFENVYAVSNVNTYFGRYDWVTGDLGKYEIRPVYANEEALLAANIDFEFSGPYWKYEENRLPVFMYRENAYDVLAVTSLGNVGEIDGSTDLNVSLENVLGDVLSVSLGGTEINYSISTDYITISKNDIDSVKEITIVTDKALYSATYNLVDLIVKDSLSFNTFVSWGTEGSHANATIVFASNIDYNNDMLNGLWKTTAFSGTIDGRGYAVKNITTKSGIFFRLASTSLIQNLGLVNVQVVAGEAGDNGFNVASGIVANSNGTFRDCYFDIHFTMDVNAITTLTMIGGITTNRYTDYGSIKIYDSIVKVDATSDVLNASTDKIHSLKGALESITDEGTCSDVVSKVYVVSNFSSCYGRIVYALNDPIYASEEALLNQDVNYGFAGAYWTYSDGKLPALVHGADAYDKMQVVDLGSLGYCDAESDYVIDLSSVEGTVSSINIGGKDIEFSVAENKATVAAGQLASVASGEVAVKITANALYLATVSKVDLVIKDSTSFNTFLTWGTEGTHASATILFGSNIDYNNGLVNGLWKTTAFNGIIDGQGYSLKNVTTKSGIFYRLGSSSQLKNLGLLNVQVVAGEAGDYGFNVASGIVANCNGVMTDCYFDIHFTMDVNEITTMTMIGGITTNRYSDFGAIKLYNCIVKVDATSDILNASTDKIHSLKGALESITDEGTCSDVVSKVYVISNFASCYGRVVYALNDPIYANDQALLNQDINFGFTGAFWTYTDGNLPKLVNMD